MHVTQVARIAYEVDRAFRGMAGDDSVPHWDRASPVARQAASINVRALAQGGIVPESQHEAWCAELMRNGWVRGERLDVEAKTHPQLVEYTELPLDVRIRDALVVAVVRGALGLPEPAGVTQGAEPQ